MTTSLIPMIRSGPDDVFGIDDLSCDGVNVEASMALADPGLAPNGQVAPGLLGVLADNVLGYAALTTWPQRWSVTTEMTLCAYPVLQRERGRLFATAHVAQADTLSAFTIGQICSASGEVVASCTQRARFVDLAPITTKPPQGQGPPPSPSHPLNLLPEISTSSEAALRVQVSPDLRNPLGNLHGGVSLYLCDAVASLTRGAMSELVTTSVQVHYLRAVRANSRIDFRPRIVHRGRTLSVEDVDGVLDGGQRAVVARLSAQPLA